MTPNERRKAARCLHKGLDWLNHWSGSIGLILAFVVLIFAYRQFSSTATEIEAGVNHFSPGSDTIVVPSAGTAYEQNIALGGTLSSATSGSVTSETTLYLSVCTLGKYRGLKDRPLRQPRCWTHPVNVGLGAWSAYPVQIGPPGNISQPAFYLIRLDLVSAKQFHELALRESSRDQIRANQAAARVAHLLKDTTPVAETSIIRPETASL